MIIILLECYLDNNKKTINFMDEEIYQRKFKEIKKCYAEFVIK